MKKRAFVRYSKQGKIVPGSLILTSGSFPQGSSTWNEVPADLCCLQPQDYSSCVALQGVALNTNPGFYGFRLQTRNNGGANMTGSIYWAPGEVEHFSVLADGSNYDFEYNFEDNVLHTVYLCVNNPSQMQDFELGSGQGFTFAVNNAYKLNGIEEWDTNNTAIFSLDLSGLSSLQQLFQNGTILGYVNITGCKNLNDVELTNNALSEDTVNHILITLDDNGLLNGYVDLSGGASAVPSGLGATAATNLTGKGWTVTTN